MAITTPASLDEVIHRTARFDGGTVTFGTCADVGEVHALLADDNGARQIVVTGGSGTGKTELLRSLHDGATAAGVETYLVDALRHDSMQVAARLKALANEISDEAATQGRKLTDLNLPLRLLLVDAQSEFNDDTLDALELAAKFGRRMNIALVVASQDTRLAGPVGAVMRHLTDATLIHLNGDQSGVGEVSGDLFRAWCAA